MASHGEAGAEKKQQAAHFVFVPLMLPGHLIPAVDTALLLAANGALCTIMGTPATAALVRPTVESSGQLEAVRVVEFPLDYAEAGLPHGADDGGSIHLMHMRNYLMRGMPLLRAPIEAYLRSGHDPYPTCVVSDLCHPWTTELAANLHVPRLSFSSLCALCLLCQHNIRKYNVYDGTQDRNEPAVVPGLGRKLELTRSQAPVFFGAPGWEDFADHMERAQAEADGIIVNSFLELEPEYVAAYTAARRMKVWTVGPVSLYHDHSSQSLAARGGRTSPNNNAGDACMRWLDGKKPHSVVYVSFGSMLQADPKQAVELGLGLEASGHPFIWVFRDGEEYDETVRGFLRSLQTRIAGRGLLISGWAPQVMILSHEAVGGVVTHCGWNSTLEAITAGLPVLTWPHCTDAFLNEKLAVEVLGIGVSVGVKEPLALQMVKKEVVVGREAVEKAVRRVMDGGEEGKERRGRAAALAAKAKVAMLEGGSSHANLLNLVKHFRKDAAHV